MKPGKDKSVRKRGAPLLDVQELELELEQQPASQDCKQETQEVQSNPEEGQQEVPSGPQERT